MAEDVIEVVVENVKVTIDQAVKSDLDVATTLISQKEDVPIDHLKKEDVLLLIDHVDLEENKKNTD